MKNACLIAALAFLFVPPGVVVVSLALAPPPTPGFR
jgi:putative effector of murein hydrolase LrgA (UPF0299 family)